MQSPSASVAHFIAPAPAGGAETVVRVLAGTRLRAGRPTRVITLLDRPEPHPFVESLRGEGIPVDVIPSGNRRYLWEARQTGSLLKQNGVQLLHTHGSHANVLGGLACGREGVAHVVTQHGHTGEWGWKVVLYQWLDHRAMKRAAAVVAVSGATEEALLVAGIPTRTLHLVRNGLAGVEPLSREEARSRLGLPLDRPVVGWVGRLSHEKGGDLLLDALATLDVDAATPGALVLMVGEGAERAALETRIGDLAARGVEVRLAGSRADAPLLSRAFDLLAISSRVENLPMVLLEAAAAGTPVVAFGVGGIPEVLDAGSGWVVPPGDTGALGRALQEVLQNPDEGERRAAVARERVERDFGVDQWRDRTEDVYTQALEGFRR